MCITTALLSAMMYIHSSVVTLIYALLVYIAGLGTTTLMKVCTYMYIHELYTLACVCNCVVCAHRGEKESSSGSRLARGLQSIWHHLLLIFIKERELHHHCGREEDQGILYELSLLFLLSPPSIYVLFLLLLLQTLLLIFYVYVTFRFCVGVCLLCTTVYTSFTTEDVYTCTRVHCIAVSRV